MDIVEHRKVLVRIVYILERYNLERTRNKAILLIISKLIDELWKVKSSRDDVHLNR